MLALAIGSIDYGYPWWLSYGHLPILIAGLAIGFLGYARKWSRAAMLFVGALILWSGAALLIDRFVINVNGRASLPTQSFLATGSTICRSRPSYRARIRRSWCSNRVLRRRLSRWISLASHSTSTSDGA